MAGGRARGTVRLSAMPDCGVRINAWKAPPSVASAHQPPESSRDESGRQVAGPVEEDRGCLPVRGPNCDALRAAALAAWTENSLWSCLTGSHSLAIQVVASARITAATRLVGVISPAQSAPRCGPASWVNSGCRQPGTNTQRRMAHRRRPSCASESGSTFPGTEEGRGPSRDRPRRCKSRVPRSCVSPR